MTENNPPIATATVFLSDIIGLRSLTEDTVHYAGRRWTLFHVERSDDVATCAIYRSQDGDAVHELIVYAD